MKLWKSKVRTPIDLACVKWSNIFFGMMVGAFPANYVRQYLALFIIAALVLVFYFGNERKANQ